MPAKKVNYGIDAPGVIRNLIGIGAIILILVIIFPVIRIGSVAVETRGLIWSACFIMLGGVLMLFYSLKGKFIHAKRMLGQVQWQGNEQVLDVGTGKGLLMIGAAKNLTTGKATGIDIWNAEDLSGNNYENAMANAAAEGVEDKVEVLNENAMNMRFAGNTFDVVLTNQVIHNIYNKEGRFTACREIARILKPGGVAIISDFRHMSEYDDNFKTMGLKVQMLGANYLTTYPPLKILIVTK